MERIVVVENLDPSKEYDSQTLILIFCSVKKLDPGDFDLCSWYGDLHIIIVGMLKYVKIYFCSCYINFYLGFFPTNYLLPESILIRNLYVEKRFTILPFYFFDKDLISTSRGFWNENLRTYPCKIYWNRQIYLL